MTTTVDASTDSYATMHLAEVEKEISLIDAAMVDTRERIEKFVERNPQCCTIFAHGLPAVRIGAMEQRDPTLRALETELDSLVTLWHATLKEFADLKGKMRQG